jgi:hypothetical protein
LLIGSLSVFFQFRFQFNFRFSFVSCRVSFRVHFLESWCQPCRGSSSSVPSFACGPFCGDTSGLRCDAAPGVASVVKSRRVPSASGSSADVVLGSNFGRTTFRELRVDSPTHYRFNIWRRPPSGRQVPQVASCESRAWRSGSAIIPVGGLPNAMALIVPRCQPSGPSRSPKIYRTVLPFTVLPWSRNPSSSSEIEVIILH